MTRETKIGLLVGLAFIIVIGILLSDHFRASNEIPQAVLTDAGPSVRGSVNNPGEAAPRITMVIPPDAPPAGSVPTQNELAPRPNPVIPSQNYVPTPAVASRNIPQPAPVDQNISNAQGQDHGADLPDPRATALAKAAQERGEALVRVPAEGTGPAVIEPMPVKPQAPVATDVTPQTTSKSYKAQPGDSVSRMAARFMNGNTRANRQAIIDANPSLQDDPDRIIVGKSYVIPSAYQTIAVISPESGQPQVVTPVTPAAPSTSHGADTYTVQEGDSLWRIANEELGDASEVDAIKDLNRNVLKGANHDVVVPGMSLRLPGKKVASAN